MGNFGYFLCYKYVQDRNLRQSHETRFKQKFKTKLNKLWWETFMLEMFARILPL